MVKRVCLGLGFGSILTSIFSVFLIFSVFAEGNAPSIDGIPSLAQKGAHFNTAVEALKGQPSGVDAQILAQLNEAVASKDLELPDLVNELTQIVARNDLPNETVAADIVYKLTAAKLADDVSDALGKGRFFLRNLLKGWAKAGLSLRDLEAILKLKNNGQALRIEVPFLMDHIDRANQRLNNISVSSEPSAKPLRLSDLFVFTQSAGQLIEDPVTGRPDGMIVNGQKFSLGSAWPGESAKVHSGMNRLRKLTIPQLALFSAFLGGLAEGLHIEGAGAAAESLRRASELWPYAVGGVGGFYVFQKLFKSTKLGKNSTVTFASAFVLASILGVAQHFGGEALKYVIPGLIVGGLFNLYEMFFSINSAWCATKLWYGGWAEALLKKLGRKTSLSHGARTGVGIGTITAVNIAYPLSGEVVKSLAKWAIVGSAFSVSVGGNIQDGLLFTAAVGLSQIMLAGLKGKGDLGELYRFTMENVLVALNAAIARVLIVASATLAVYGQNTMWATAALVTLPLIIYSISLPKLETWSDRSTSKLFQKGGSKPGLLAKVGLTKFTEGIGSAVGAVGSACARGLRAFGRE